MARPWLPDEVIERIKRLLAEGWTIQEVADACHVGVATVHKVKEGKR